MTSVTAPAPSEKAARVTSTSSSGSGSKAQQENAHMATAASKTNDAGINNTQNNNNNNNTQNNDVLFQAIASKASAAMSQPTVTLTIYIPSTAVGAVIGRRGQNIASLQKTAAMSAHTSQAVRVSIVGQADTANSSNDTDQDGYPLSDNHSHNPSMMTTSSSGNNNNNNGNGAGAGAGTGSSSIPYTYSKLDWSDIAWTPVVVRADPCAALAAAYKLSDMVDGAIDQVVLDIPVSRTKHAAIVGKRGVALANMSAETGVRIMVPNKMTRHDVVQLEGCLDNVCQCLVKVLHIAAKATSSSKQSQQSQASTSNNNKQNGGDDPSGTTTANASGLTTETSPNLAGNNITRTTATVTVPQLPSQTKIRNLGRKTDCTIKKKKMMNSSPASWQLTITGMRAEQVQAAVAILNKWKEDNGLGGGTAAAAGGAGAGTGGSAAAAPAPPPATGDGTDNSSTTATGTPAPSPSRRNNNRGRGGGGGRNSSSSSSNNNNNNKGTPKRGGKPQNRPASSD